MALSGVVGQEKIADFLLNVIKNKRIAHAYIFSGPKGVEKKDMAVQFAKALNCMENQNDSCDKCINCMKIEHFNHPDVLYINPSGKTIKIDQIRQLQKSLNFLAVGVNYKVLIIEQAELLTQQAANSLLKFLEEPKAKVVIILMVENQYQLLPTIRSRCQIINFNQVDFEVIKSKYDSDGISEGDLLLASYITDDVSELGELVTSDEFVQMKNLMIQWNQEILTRGYQALLTINDRILKSEYVKDNILHFLDLMIVWYRDMLNIRLERNDFLIYKDYQKELHSQVAKISEGQIISQIEKILSTKNRLKNNANLQISLEQLVLAI